MSKRLNLAAALGVLTAFAAGHASADLVTPESTFRKVTGETGNCIFSSESLPFKKENLYTKVSTSFSTGNVPVEMRCYYPTQLKDYKQRGAFWNQIRNEGVYLDYFTVESPDGDEVQFEYLGQFHSEPKTDEWDQMRIPMDPAHGLCAIKDHTSAARDGCVDIDRQVRDLAKKVGAALPYTAKLCISMSYKYSDTFEEKYDEFRESIKRSRTQVKTHRFALGCVEYTAK